MSLIIGVWPILIALLATLVIPVLVYALGFFVRKNVEIIKALNLKK